MKRNPSSIIALAILVSLFASCVSLQDRPITAQERTESGTVGTVSTNFTSFRFLHFTGASGIKNKAYTQLLADARKQYGANVDVRNISISGGASGWEALFFPAALLIPMGISMAAFPPEEMDFAVLAGLGVGSMINLLGHFEKICVTGDVIRAGAGAPAVPPPTPAAFQGVEGAVDKASATLIGAMRTAMPRSSIVAILNVSSNNQDMAAYIINRLEFNVVEADYFQTVNRSRLEQIRAEQNFQISGEVNDSSAVSIGNLLGAGVVITGDVTSSGTSQWLTLRALDVRTGVTIRMAMESF